MIDFRSLYINRNFTWLWMGQALSTLGEFSMISALSVWVTITLFHGSSDLPLAVGLVLGIPRIPSILLSSLAGAMVDRYPPKRFMLIADGARAILYLLLYFALSLAHSSQWMTLFIVITIITASELFSLFFNPARAVIMQHVTPPEKRIQASTLSNMSSQGVALITSFSGPVMYGFFGIRYAVLVNMASFVISFICVSKTRHLSIEQMAPSQKPSLWKDMGFALTFIFRHPSLCIIFLGSLCYAISLGVDSPLISQFPLTTLKLTPTEYGMLSLCFPLGGILMMLANNRILQRWGSMNVFTVSLILLGIIKLAFAASNAIDVYLFMLMIGATFALTMASLGPELQNTIPNQHMGKISPVFTQATSIISTFFLFFSSALLTQVNHWLPTSDSALKYRMALGCSAGLLMIGGLLVYGAHQWMTRKKANKE